MRCYLHQQVHGAKCGGWLAHQAAEPGWVDGIEIQDAANFRPQGAQMEHAPRILVIYGSLRERSFSRLMAFEAARVLERCGFDVRCYCPSGLPLRDPELEAHPKVQELRYLSTWSEGHVWSSPEMHGNLTGVFKTQIDWLPLNTGSVRPTQGRTAVVMQVNGGSQSFNAVNSMRVLARWMRMPCCTNQSSVPKAWQEFDDSGRMTDSPFRERLVDVMEEFAKFTRIMREHADFLVDRHSEREEKRREGRLLSQAEKEAAKAGGASS
eukprot:jgi/Tetstr1/454502/TSEL_041402.t1